MTRPGTILRRLAVRTFLAGAILLPASAVRGGALLEAPSFFALRPGVSPSLELQASRTRTSASRALRAEPATLPVVAVLASETSVPQLVSAGFRVHGHVGRVVSLEVTDDQLSALGRLPYVLSLRRRAQWRMLLDVNGQENGAAAARLGGASGAGTLLAVIDSGIDFRHQDFRHENGDTRIRFLWDQFDSSYFSSGGTIGSPPPAPVGDDFEEMGTVYTEAQINAALVGAAEVNSVDLVGHGTLVASAAAGNGRAGSGEHPSGVYVGTAPQASLLVVRMGGLDKNDFGLPGDLITALAWIDARADELGLPVVVNMSFGDHIASHDGTNPEELAIDAFTAEPGRAVVAAAGNEADQDIHASGSTSGTATLEVFQSGLSDSILVDCWLPGSDRVDVGFRDPRDVGNDNMNVSAGFCGSVAGTPNRITACVGDLDPLNGDREVFFIVEPLSSLAPISSGVWRFHLRDEGAVQNGRFDCWSPNGQPFVAHVDESMLVGSPGTARGALTVGAYSARDRWPSQSGESVNGTQPGAIAFFSSPGPTRDGRLKPELTAGGQAVVGAWSSADGTGSGIAGVPPRPNLVTPDGQHVASNGTSFATPQIAGAVALLFERDPLLGASEVLEILTGTARADPFTGDVPNPLWGRGKVDVAAAVAALAAEVSFPGDSNCDMQLDEADRQATFTALFDHRARCSADCNRDGATNAADLSCTAVRAAE